MTRCLLLSGIASVLLSSVCMQAQTPSTDNGAPPKAMSILTKSQKPIPAAHKPVFVPTGLDLKASIGYAYTIMNVPSASRLNLNGVDVAVIADLSPFFGVTADSSYVRAPNVFGTSHAASVLSYLGGPVLYPVSHGRIRAYIHGLAGGARVAGAIPSSGSSPATGFVNKLSWAVGSNINSRHWWHCELVVTINIHIFTIRIFKYGVKTTFALCAVSCSLFGSTQEEGFEDLVHRCLRSEVHITYSRSLGFAIYSSSLPRQQGIASRTSSGELR